MSDNIKRFYSKSSSFYLETKKNFFTDNKKLLEKQTAINSLYVKQPKRFDCKICGAKLSDERDFLSHGVGYIFCDQCFHLNGIHDDTQNFVDNLYISDGGASYSESYIQSSFLSRVNDVYIPKLDFLKKSLSCKEASILDVGCGCGYFVCAGLLNNFDVRGIDVNQKMIDFGNSSMLSHLGVLPLLCCSEDDFYHKVINSDAEVISAIGVIEHLRHPEKFFDAFCKSKAKYVYYSVPMLSFSVFTENVFKNVFPRQLSGGHTHLFSENSIKAMNTRMQVDSVAEWRFGTDILDIYRSISISLEENFVSERALGFFRNNFLKVIDDLQSVLDKNHFCSEIHVLAVKK